MSRDDPPKDFTTVVVPYHDREKVVRSTDSLKQQLKELVEAELEDTSRPFNTFGSYNLNAPPGHRYSLTDKVQRKRVWYPKSEFIALITNISKLHINGILVVSFIFLAFYEMWALFVVYIFEYAGFQKTFANRNLGLAFSSLELIIAFIYRDAIITVYGNLTGKLGLLFGLLQTTDDCVDELVASINPHHFIPDSPLEKSRAIKHVRYCYEILSVLPNTYHRFFDKSQKERTPVYNEYITSLLLPHVGFKSMKKPSRKIQCFLIEFKKLIGKLSDGGFVNETQATALYKACDDILVALQKSIQSKYVKTPNIFIAIYSVVVLIYVVVVLPINMYQYVDILTPLIYPFVTFLLTAPFIFYYFYGKPFTKRGTHIGMHYNIWIKESEAYCAHWANYNLKMLEGKTGGTTK